MQNKWVESVGFWKPKTCNYCYAQWCCWLDISDELGQHALCVSSCATASTCLASEVKD